MNANNFDVVVIGVGSMGPASCYWLAKRGYKVLALEQFSIPYSPIIFGTRRAYGT